MKYEHEGIEYEETGEERWPEPGEHYVTYNGGVLEANASSSHGVANMNGRKRKILRRVDVFAVGDTVEILPCPEWPKICYNYVGKFVTVRKAGFADGNEYYKTGPNILLKNGDNVFQWPVKYVRKVAPREKRPPQIGEQYLEKGSDAVHTAKVQPMPSREIVPLTPAQFYRHVWNFPPPFELGVKPPQKMPEPCACCKGHKTVSASAICPECNGTGTHEIRC